MYAKPRPCTAGLAADVPIRLSVAVHIGRSYRALAWAFAHHRGRPALAAAEGSFTRTLTHHHLPSLRRRFLPTIRLLCYCYNRQTRQTCKQDVGLHLLFSCVIGNGRATYLPAEG